MNLNLGSGSDRLPGFSNVDVRESIFVDYVVDLNSTDWPFPDDSIEYIRAYHVFEHLKDKANTFNQCWRILKPYSILEFEVPTTDGWGAFSDPQHVSFWNEDVLNYISQEMNSICYQFGKSSGLNCNFKIQAFHTYLLRKNVPCLNVVAIKQPL